MSAGLRPHFALVFPEAPERCGGWRAGWISGVLACVCGALVLGDLRGTRHRLERLDRWDAILASICERSAEFEPATS